MTSDCECEACSWNDKIKLNRDSDTAEKALHSLFAVTDREPHDGGKSNNPQMTLE